MRSRTLALLGLLSLSTITQAAAQDDLRDQVELKNGRTLKGRVRTPFATDELLVLQGGKRKRVPVKLVQSMRTVRRSVAELVRLRLAAGEDARRHWPLVQWAEDRQLPTLARLQAEWVLTLDPDHEAAHLLLDHRLHPKRGWLWPDDGRFRTLTELEEAHADFGQGLVRSSEHFVLTSDAGLRATVATLFDLESLYATLFERFGEPLQLVESMRPIEMQAHRDVESFPRWGAVIAGYYVPHPFGDFGKVFHQGDPVRPDDLFTVATQAILYRCLAENAAQQNQLDRFAAWAEIGFGLAMQARFAGPPGLARAGAVRRDPQAANQALHFRRYGLPNLIHLTLRDHFYGALMTSGEPHFASAHQFVEFLLDDGRDPPLAPGFLRFLRSAVGEGRGDSSSVFDKAVGIEIEKLERPFAAWLVATGGAAARR